MQDNSLGNCPFFMPDIQRYSHIIPLALQDSLYEIS